jgi:hypothetical protein
MAAMAAFWGVFAFFGVASNPRFETIHVLDMIRLMTAGAALAVTIAGLIMFFVFRAEDKRAGEKSDQESK